MADYFFDTSALVKRHVIEVGSAWVRSLVRARRPMTSISPASPPSRSHPRSPAGSTVATFLAAQAGAMLGHFRRHIAQRYHVIELTPALFDDAARAAHKHRLRAYDAVQLAVALDLDGRQQDAAWGR